LRLRNTEFHRQHLHTHAVDRAGRWIAYAARRHRGAGLFYRSRFRHWEQQNVHERGHWLAAQHSAGGDPTNIAEKSITITAPALTWDLAVEKEFTQITGGFHVKLSVTNTQSNPVYIDKIVRLIDRLRTNASPIPALKYTLTNFVCNTAKCPVLPGPNTSTLLFANQQLLNINWVGPPLDPIFLDAAEKTEIEFDILFDPGCLRGSISFENQALLALGQLGTVYQDADQDNNNPIEGPLTFTYDGGGCPSGSKAVTLPADPNSVKWEISGSAGDEVEYTITLSNPSPSPVTIDVKDEIRKAQYTPPFSWLVTSPPVCTPNPCTALTTTSFTVVDLNPHEIFTVSVLVPGSGGTPPTPGTATVKFRVKFTPLENCQTTTANNTIINTASFSASGNQVGSSSAAVVMTPLDICDLIVTKKVEGNVTEVKFGQPITYTVTYTNDSSMQPVTIRTLRDTMIVDNSSYGGVPVTVDSTSHCSSSWGAPIMLAPATIAHWQGNAWSGNPLVNLASPTVFPPNGVVTCTIAITAQPPTGTGCGSSGNLVNAAFMAAEVWPLFGNQKPFDYEEIKLQLPVCRNITIGKVADTNVVAPGGIVTFTIVVHNGGSASQSGIVLTDPMPAGFQIQSANCVQGTTPSGPPCTTQPTFTVSSLSLNLDPLAGGADVSIIVKAKAPSVGGSYRNTAVIDLVNQGNVYLTGGNTSEAAQVQILTPVLTKVFDPMVTKQGDEVTLVFTILNSTGSSWSPVQFTDKLPAGLDIIGADAAGTTCQGNLQFGPGTIAYSNGTVGPQGCKITVKIRVAGCSVVNRWTENQSESNIIEVINLDPTEYRLR
jgi:uncharacterized repeat protein (TIGR01451 family)